MKIKKLQVRPAIEALKGVKMQRIEDKALRRAVIAAYVRLLEIQGGIDRELDNLETATLGAYAAERKELESLRDDIQAAGSKEKAKAIADDIIARFGELLAAERAHKREALALLSVDTEGPDPIDRDAFIDAMAAQEWNFALLEAVYPLLAAKPAKE